MSQVGDAGWDVRVEDRTVVVELGRRLALDDRGSERLSEAISAAVADDVDRVLAVVDVEHPLSAALRDAIVRGAHTAATEGVTDWRVVGEHERKAAAMARALPGVETAVFADEREARTRVA